MNLLVYRRCVISLLTALTVSVSLGLSGCGGDAPGSSGAVASLKSQQAAAAPAAQSESAAPQSRRLSRQIAVGPPPMGWSSWDSPAENGNYNKIKAQTHGPSP